MNKNFIEIIKPIEKCRILLHTTYEETAKKILKDGFCFYNELSYTTDEVSMEPADFMWKITMRKNIAIPILLNFN